MPSLVGSEMCIRDRYYNKQKTVILATMIFAIIIIVLSLLGTIGTILSNLVLRKREFGIHYAMGLSKKHLLIMTLGEGMVMFFISFVISIAGSLAVTFFMASEGFKITLENVAITLLVMIVCMVVCLSLIHISEPTRLGMISYAVFCLKKKKNN